MIDYYVTTTIHLSLETYHNEGLTSEETKEIIEKIQDPSMPDFSISNRLRCTPQHINGNWNVRAYSDDPDLIHSVVRTIEWHLQMGLKAKGTKAIKKTLQDRKREWEKGKGKRSLTYQRDMILSL